MTFKSNVEQILYSGNNYLEIKKSLDALHEFYGNRTGIWAGPLTDEKKISTAYGEIVTPVHAAHCLLDIGRTVQFLKGIHRAIKFYLSRQDKVRILYAGCGPYATLVTPFTALYTPDQLSFTLLEYNPVSIEAVEGLYKQMNLEKFVEEVVEADAVAEDLLLAGGYDIIISETMQKALKNECQVPLTRNTVRFLQPKGTFIPQNIFIDACLTGKEDPADPSNLEKENIGRVYDLDFRSVPSRNHQTQLSFPQTSLQRIQLYTTIRVYGDVVIKPFQSGLTLPSNMGTVDPENTKTVTFIYRESDKPGFEMRVENT